MTTPFGRNITIDGGANAAAARAYETRLLGLLTMLLATRTGNAVISEIWNSGARTLRILRHSMSEINADSTATSWADATLAMEPQRLASGAAIPGAPLGTGRGSDVLIHYSPTLHMEDTELRLPHLVTASGDAAAPGGDRALVLLHELAHALRQIRGVQDMRALPAARPSSFSGGNPERFDNVDELYAITVSNIYASERGLPLRADHNGERLLQNGNFWREPTLFFHLRRCFDSLPGLKARLAGIVTAFNPVRDMANGVEAYMRLMDENGRIRDPYSR